MAHFEEETSNRLFQTLEKWDEFLKKYAPFFKEGSYIRSKLLNENEAPRRARTRTRKPLKDEQALALLLGELGKARIANNLNQLARPQIQVPCLSRRTPKKPSRGPVMP